MDKETKEPKCENDDEKPILIPDIASCKKIKPKPGILRLDIAKPRRPSGGSVEFRMEPALLGDSPQSERIDDPYFDHQYNENVEARILKAPRLKQRKSVSLYGRRNQRSNDYFSYGNFFEPNFMESNNPLDTQDNSEDEDYSISVSAIMQRRASTKSYKKKGNKNSRRSSSVMGPTVGFSGNYNLPANRRRSSMFTTSSGETVVSLGEETNQNSTQEQIFENIRLHKDVLQSVKLQPWTMKRKLRLVRQAKEYVARHEGALQERLAMTRSTKDLAARIKMLLVARLQHYRREIANISTVLTPWELRIKEIESHFGSVVASYFTFLRWLFWVNIVITLLLIVFVVAPERIAYDPRFNDTRKCVLEEEVARAGNIKVLWGFEGYLEYSPLFYGYYSDYSGAVKWGYNLPLAYFLTGLVVYIYSFVATLRKMAENSRSSKTSTKDDECLFSWKVFTGWDFMIGHAETAHNRTAAVILGFKEALLEEAEKKKAKRNWKIIVLRIFVNLIVLFLLFVSAWVVVYVVNRKGHDNEEEEEWWRPNEITVVVTFLSFAFPMIFEAIGFMEYYHPRQQLRLQLARIMLLNLINSYAMIFALFRKIIELNEALEAIRQPNTTTSMQCAKTERMFPTEYLDSMEDSYSAAALVQQTIESVTMSVAALINSTPSTWLTSTSITPTVPSTTLGPNCRRIKVKCFSNTTLMSTLLLLNLGQPPTMQTDFNYTTNFDLSTGDYDYETNVTDIPFTSTTLDYMDYNDTSDYEDFMNRSRRQTYRRYQSNDENEDYAYEYDEFKQPVDNQYPQENEDDYQISSTTEMESTTTVLNESFSWSTTLESEFNATDTTSIVTDETTSSIDYSDYTDASSEEQLIDDEEKECFITVCDTTTAVDYETTTDENLTEGTDSFTSIEFSTTIMPSNTTVPIENRTKTRELCWETMFGQELMKLTVMDLVFMIASILFFDFFRAIFVRFMNKCWCWDLEKKFPKYGDFKMAENILHLIHGQGMVWMGLFFSPGLAIMNLFKLVIIMYLRSWTVLTCNVPHEVIFRASRSNNFYLWLLLTMLFLCVLPVGYAIVWLRPSYYCGPFSGSEHIYLYFTSTLRSALPKTLQGPLDYIASPSAIIPLLLLLILIIYYLVSLTRTLRESNQDLRNQLRRERVEVRRKLRKVVEEPLNTPSAISARWRKVLEASSPISPTANDSQKEADEQKAQARKELLAKIFKRVDRKGSGTSEEESHINSVHCDGVDDETDTEQHDSLPHDELKCDDHRNKKSESVRSKPQRKPSFTIHDIVHMAAKKEARELARKQKLQQQQKEQQQSESLEETDLETRERVVSERRRSLLKRQNGVTSDKIIQDDTNYEVINEKNKEHEKKSLLNSPKQRDEFKFDECSKSTVTNNKSEQFEKMGSSSSSTSNEAKTKTNDGVVQLKITYGKQPTEQKSDNIKTKASGSADQKKMSPKKGDAVVKGATPKMVPTASPKEKFQSFLMLVREAVNVKRNEERQESNPSAHQPYSLPSVRNSFRGKPKVNRSESIPKRQDSQASIWSDNIPVITISKTESDECILEDAKNENKINSTSEKPE